VALWDVARGAACFALAVPRGHEGAAECVSHLSAGSGVLLVAAGNTVHAFAIVQPGCEQMSSEPATVANKA
jgi:hypothetical protein